MSRAASSIWRRSSGCIQWDGLVNRVRSLPPSCSWPPPTPHSSPVSSCRSTAATWRSRRDGLLDGVGQSVSRSVGKDEGDLAVNRGWLRPTYDSQLRLLAYPLPASALRPHPGGGVGAGTGVEDVVLGERGAKPGSRLELEQPVRPARFVDRRRHQIGLTAGHAHHVLARLSVAVSGVIDDGDQLAPPPGGRVAGRSGRRPPARGKMSAKGPAGGILPANFDEAVTLLARRHYPLAARHHRRHRRVLTWALVEIEIDRGDDVARTAERFIPIPAAPGHSITATSALLQRDDVRLLGCFAGARVGRRGDGLRRDVTSQNVAFELTVASPIPAVLCLAVDGYDRALGQPQERLSPALRCGAEASLGDGGSRAGRYQRQRRQCNKSQP